MRPLAIAISLATLLGFGVLGAVTAFSRVQDAPPSRQGQEVTPEQIATWIRELDADDFQTRESATESLAEAGMKALDPLVAAAQGGSLEVTTRAMDVITRLFEKSEGDTQSRVKAALEQIIAGDNKAAASRADAVLNPPQTQQQANQALPAMGGFNIVFGGGANMQIQSSTDAQGNKTINAKEGDREVDISEKADGSIKMTVKEKVDGKEQSKEYAAKDQDELKEKHKEAFELYEKYAKQMNGIRIPQVQLGRIRALPVAPAIRLVNPAQQQAAMDAMQEAQKELKAAVSAMKKLAEGDADQITPEAMQELIRQVEEAEKKVQEASEKIGG